MRIIRYLAVPLAGLALLAPTAARADFAVSPPATTNVNGDNSINDPLIGFFGGQRTARTFMVQYGDNVLNIPVGATITGISFRHDEFNPLPTGTVTFGDYEIYLAGATRTIQDLVATPAAQSYGANMAGETLVRDGALVVNYDAYPDAATSQTPPNPFGPEITFSSGYVYTGGSLVVYVAHNGYPTGPNSVAPVDSQNFLNPGTGGNSEDGYVLIRSDFSGAGTNATNQSPDNFIPNGTGPLGPVASSVPIIRFTFTPAFVNGPEPGALALLFVGGVGLGIARRRSR